MRPTRRLLVLAAVAAVIVGLASAADQASPPPSRPAPAQGGLGAAASPATAPTSSDGGGGGSDGENGGLAAAPASAPPALAPLARALASNYTTFWDVVTAARMEKLFDDPTARLTVLAPTNEAWLKRLPSLTTGANLTLAQLLAKERVIEQVLNYHAIPGPGIDSLEKLALRGRLPTNAASCSTSKEIQVAAEQPAGTANGGQVTLASSLGGTARTVGPPQLVSGGSSSIIPIDDVLLPSTVVVPTLDALAGPSAAGQSALPPSKIAALQSALDGKEPLPLTDEVGLDARDRAARGATGARLPVVGGDGGTVPDQPAPARRRVTVPTLAG
jgi:uncharacterized surface protein with fasciclin (FAS1) repeats